MLVAHLAIGNKALLKCLIWLTSIITISAAVAGQADERIAARCCGTSMPSDAAGKAGMLTLMTHL
ncbi:MAG: hypothetical protein ABJI14_15855, partial [Marinomonas sp.]